MPPSVSVLQMGNFVHYMSTFVAGFVVGFVNEWTIAVVTLAVLPLIAAAGGYYAIALTGLTSKSAEAYERAGSIAEEVMYCTGLYGLVHAVQSKSVEFVIVGGLTCHPIVSTDADDRPSSDRLLFRRRAEIRPALQPFSGEHSEARLQIGLGQGNWNGWHLRSSLRLLGLASVVRRYPGAQGESQWRRGSLVHLSCHHRRPVRFAYPLATLWL